MSLIKTVEGTPTIDMEQFFGVIGEADRSDKLTVALAQAGCRAWDEEGRYIRTPSVALTGIGGFPISEEMLSQYRAKRTIIPGASGGFSYLNARGKDLPALYDTVTGHGHYSIAHTATANVLVAGVSAGVENEFNSQRDVVHLSRLTVARTGIQERPPIIVPRAELLAPTKAITEYTDGVLADITANKLDDWEGRNLLYPTAKATLFLATASLRNFQKLVAQRHDGGKEAEYVRALGLIDDCLGTVWPELFGEKE